jgi:multimeric flavodoxin WrbA
MNILAIDGSPRGAGGITALVLKPFLEGLGGAELIHTKDLDIRPCRGDFVCWYRTPGECHQDDDMRAVLERIAAADVLMLATPLYVDGMSGPLKNLLDRMIPLLEPEFVLRDGHCRHPLREGVRAGKLVLVSSCGFHELDNFDPLLVHVRAACETMSRDFAGALLRPHGWVLRYLLKRGEAQDVLDAARRAGEEFAEKGVMSAETLAAVSRELVSLEECVRLQNE